MKKKFLSVILGLMIGSFAYSQNIGVDYFGAGELKVAQEVFEKQLAGSPAEASYYLGEIAFAQGNLDKAKSFYEKGLAASPDFVLNNVGLGKLLLKSDPKAADEMFSVALKKNKKDVEVLVAIARSYFQVGQKEKALEKLENARKADKKSPLIYILEGDIMKSNNNIGEAAGQYAQAINFDSNCALAYLKSAQVYDGINPTSAVEMLNKVLEIRPDYTVAYKYLGKIFSQNGRYGDAIDAYKAYFAKGEYDVEDLTRYAAALYFTKQYDEAKHLIEEGIKKDSKNFVLNRLLMYSYLQSEDFQNGLTAAEKFFSLDKGTSEYIAQDHITYGELLSEAKKFDQAIAQYNLAVKLDPANTGIYKTVAEMLAEAGQTADAAAYYEKYIELGGEAVVAIDYYNMGRYFYMAGNSASKNTDNAEMVAKSKEYLTKADQAFATVTERIPDNYLGYFWRARTNAALDPETSQGLAKPHYEQTVKVVLSKDEHKNDRELIEAYRYLSYYYYLAWDKSKSVDDKNNTKLYCEKILELDPTNDVANQLLNAIK